jgi:DNA-binding NarL/FixJ family response regulator
MTRARRTATQPGTRRHHGNGLCTNCYDITRRVRGKLVARGSQNDPADPVVVIRIMAGEPLPTNTAERIEAVARLTRAGMSASEIARRTRLSTRSVCRLRARAAKVAA